MRHAHWLVVFALLAPMPVASQSLSPRNVFRKDTTPSTGVGFLQQWVAGLGLPLTFQAGTRAFRFEPAPRQVSYRDAHGTTVTQTITFPFVFDIWGRVAAPKDSIAAYASEYVLSGQPSPLAVRLTWAPIIPVKPFRLAEALYVPLVIVPEYRMVPFPDAAGAFAIGHMFKGAAALSFNIPGAAEFPGSKDTGTAYVEPAVAWNYGGADLMHSVMTQQERQFWNLELRAGFKDQAKPENSFGVILDYALRDIHGGRVRLSLTATASGLK